MERAGIMTFRQGGGGFSLRSEGWGKRGGVRGASCRETIIRFSPKKAGNHALLMKD